MPKDTKNLGYIKAPACESRGFVIYKNRGCINYDTPSLSILCPALRYLKYSVSKFIPIFFANRIRHYLYVRPHHLYFLTKSRREDLTKINSYARKQTSRENLSAKEIRTSLDTEEKWNEREKTEAYRANHIYQSKRNAKKSSDTDTLRYRPYQNLSKSFQIHAIIIQQQ